MPVKIHEKKIRSEILKPALANKARRRRETIREESRQQGLVPTPRNDLRPKFNTTESLIEELRMPKRQVRKLGADDIAKVANSIQQFGVCVPIIIGKKNNVIDGVAIVEAAKSLGLKTLPCVELDHLSDADQRALRLALNKIGDDREYDLPELKIELEELVLEDQPIELLGFSGPQLDIILSEETPEPEDLTAVIDNLAEDAVTEAGDLWLLGDHRLLCADAKNEESYSVLMGSDKAQLAMTDPPYGVAVSKVVSTEHRDFVEGGGEMDQAAFEGLITSAFQNIQSSLAEGGMLMSFMDYKHVSDLVVIGNTLGFDLVNVITWVKSQGGMGSLWRSRSEFIVALKRPGKHKNNIELGKHGRDRSNVWEYAGAGTVGSDARAMLKDHPTPKPVPMLADAIYDVTDIKDIVLDPFGGSGSTLIACEETSRHARIMELDPIYCDLIVRRWEKLTGQEAVHSQSGKSFDYLAAHRNGLVDLIDE